MRMSTEPSWPSGSLVEENDGDMSEGP
jgi:hypothetical protein